MAILGVAFVPLHSVTSRTDDLMQRIQTELVESTTHSPGLRKQFEVQLENLKTKQAGCELGIFPGFLSVPSMSVIKSQELSQITRYLLDMPKPGKKYLTVTPVFNHPFSRGSIVRDTLQYWSYIIHLDP